LVTMEIPV